MSLRQAMGLVLCVVGWAGLTVTAAAALWLAAAVSAWNHAGDRALPAVVALTGAAWLSGGLLIAGRRLRRG